MAPSTFASNQSFVRQASESDAQPYSSLFGDPVPPPLQPDDYFGTAAFETLRNGSVELPSSEEDALVAAMALNALIPAARERIFPSVPYSRTPRGSLLPYLQPPDIQILPNSSGGSSSEQLGSPNYRLLAPDDILNKPDVYDLENEVEEYTVVGQRMSFDDEEDETARTPSQAPAKLSVSSITTEDHRGLVFEYTNILFKLILRDYLLLDYSVTPIREGIGSVRRHSTFQSSHASHDCGPAPK